jgi:hypothetical protein
MNDLVRVCILLASHAPVRQIVVGQVERATTLQRDTRVELRVDPTRVRVGMRVLMFSGQEVVAQGVVDDLAAGRAAARVVQLKAGQTSVNLAQDARVQFAEPEAGDDLDRYATLPAAAERIRDGLL